MASCLLFLLASAVLLAHGVTVCATQESDLVVLTTASQLRREIKSQLAEALAEALPTHCSSQSNASPIQNPSLCNNEDIVGAIQELTEYVKNSINITVKETVTELLTPLLSQVLHLVQPGQTPSHHATSCKEILELAPSSPSGLYWIRSSDHSARHMYCDMERSCKGVGGGWMRLASINMRDSSHQCPHGLRTLQQPRRLCAMNIDSGGIHTVPVHPYLT